MRPLPFSGGPVYALVFWCAFMVWITLEVVASKTKRASDSSRVHDRGSLVLIVILWWAGIGADFLLSLHLPQASIWGERRLAFAIGIALMFSGITLRQYSIVVLGKYFTFDVAVHSGHSLIESGPYRYVRHPSYSGALLTLIGFGLALGNWAGLATALFGMACAYTYRITVEEAALTTAIGEPYRQYVSRTWRLVPFLFQL
ncbi:MAG: isoprenylcysteine carboxylmethyltransferase family protein [Candidatus Sulfotelmatobacter sp.]